MFVYSSWSLKLCLIPCNLLFLYYFIICNRRRQKINHPVIITAVECHDPGKPTNGKQIVKKGYVYGGSVKFVCDKNYTLVGTNVIYCQANRSWSSFVPRCVGKCYWCDRIQENERHKAHLMFPLLLNIPRHSLIKLSKKHNFWI